MAASVVRLTNAPVPPYLLIDYTDPFNLGFTPIVNEFVFESGELVSLRFNSGEHCYAGLCLGGSGFSQLIMSYAKQSPQSAAAQFYASGQAVASGTALQLDLPTAVPEPTTFALLCAGLAGWGLTRRRGSRRAA